MAMTAVQGRCDARFESVRQAFSDLMNEPGQRGAGVSLYWRGETVVDLWAGTRDKDTRLPWQQNTLVNVFSTSKGVAALAVQKALDLGLLDLQKAIAYYWPEYGCEGKKDARVGWILNHRVGQPAIKTPLPDEALFDWERMTSTLAQESPWWQPGLSHGYHMVTYGWLLGEVFRRAVGISLGQFLREELAQPLGLDMFLGVPETEFSRLADLSGSRDRPQGGRLYLFDTVLGEPESMTSKALTNPKTLMTSSNAEAWRRMELPSANLHATAAALASLYGKVACREGVVSAQALRRCQQEESVGDDPVLLTRTRFGPGFLLQQVGHPETGFGPGTQAFGHPGSGGSLAFADPEQELGFGFVMNQMGPYVMVDPRPRRLVDAVYQCLTRI